MAGLVFIGCLLWNIFGFNSIFIESNDPVELSPLGFGLAGSLIGAGVMLCGDCTIGMVICGIPRLERRALVVTVCMAASAVAMAQIKYYIGLGSYLEGDTLDIPILKQ